MTDDFIERLRTESMLEIELGPFATREALIAHVLEHIYKSEKDAEEEIATGPSDLDAYFGGIVAAFDWHVDPANAFLRRATFEAASFAPHLVSPHYNRWIGEAMRDLRELGLGEADAATEARIVNNLFLGFAYDLTVNNDPATTRAVFMVSLGRYRERLVHLIELSV